MIGRIVTNSDVRFCGDWASVRGGVVERVGHDVIGMSKRHAGHRKTLVGVARVRHGNEIGHGAFNDRAGIPVNQVAMRAVGGVRRTESDSGPEDSKSKERVSEERQAR